jgi:hypothetical protein
MRSVALLSLALFALGGCVTRKAISSRPSDAGVKAVFAEDFDKVKRAAFDAMGDLAFEVKEEGWADTYLYRIVGSQGLSSGTAGRLVRIMIEKGEKERTAWILVETKLASSSSPIDETIARDLQKRLAARLAAR